jgi:hypothetical protein
MFNLLRKLQGTTTLDPPRPRKYAHVVCMLCVCAGCMCGVTGSTGQALGTPSHIHMRYVYIYACCVYVWFCDGLYGASPGHSVTIILYRFPYAMTGSTFVQKPRKYKCSFSV